jgi:hypothetical protein
MGDESRPKAAPASIHRDASITASSPGDRGYDAVRVPAYVRLVGALRAHGQKVSAGSQRGRAQCPAHGNSESQLSLSLRQVEGQALVYCFAGCDTSDVLAELGLNVRDLFDEPHGASYVYEDAEGRTLRTVLRTPAKRFTQSGQTTGPSTLYRLPKVIEAAREGATVYLVEGEKDAHALEAAGVLATTAPMGATNFKKVDATPLAGAHVVAVVDKDKAGLQWAAQVQDKLKDIAGSLTFVQAAEGKDAADHIAAEKSPEQFEPLELLPSSPRRARITWASEIEPEPVVWAWEEHGGGRIPAGSLSVAAGREGTGKSSFGIWLAARITQGTLPGSFDGEPRRVFYVAVEDSWKHTIVPRLIAANADLNMVARFDLVDNVGDELTLSLPSDNALLEDAVRQHRAALVVIDPLMSAIAERIDTHREREVRQALDPLARLADRTGAVLLGIAHFNKGNATDAASLITGSGAFKNVPRSVFGFARDDSANDGSRVMSQVKNSLGRDDLPSLSYSMESAEVHTSKGVALTGRFSFAGVSERHVMDVLRDARRDPEDVATDRSAASWIRDYLTECGGEAEARHVLAAGKDAGYAESTLKNARRKVAHTCRSGFGAGQVTTWALTAGTASGTAGTTDKNLVPAVSAEVPASEPAADQVPPRDSKPRAGCLLCGQTLLLREPGREACERCRIDEKRAS